MIPFVVDLHAQRELGRSEQHQSAQHRGRDVEHARQANIRVPRHVEHAGLCRHDSNQTRMARRNVHMLGISPQARPPNNE